MLDASQTIFRQATAAFSKGDLAGADRLCQHALTLNVRSVPALVLLGNIRTRQAKWAAAEDAFKRAGRLAPGEAEVPFGLGMLRVRQGLRDDAFHLLEKALRLKPDHPGIRMALGECHRRGGNPAAALKVIGTPTIAETHLTVGLSHLDLGQLDLAEHHLRAGIALPAHGASPRASLHLGLGQVLERRGAYDEAFREFSAARAVVPMPFDVEGVKAFGSRLRTVFSRERFERFAKLPITTDRPVFIVGMPRSGTTLIEKMIASHPQAAGAGETDALRMQIDEFDSGKNSNLRWPEIATTFDASHYAKVASTYLKGTDLFAGGSVKRVADKNLANWFHVGLIAIAFPAASIIHLRRDPMDTGLSCFERLSPSATPWSTKLEHIGVMLALNERMLAHWHEMSPGRMIEVTYEDLAQRPADVLPSVIERIGLPWNDACLRHHERVPRQGTHEPAPTLSEAQVRKPIYDSSIGRAERFGTALDPLREAYRKAREELFS